MTWDGKPRRADDTPESVCVRLALLEKQAADSEARHYENKERLQDLTSKILDLKEDFTYHLNIGLDAIMDKMEADKKEMKPCMEKIASSNQSIQWLRGWCGGMSTAIAGIIAYLGAKH